MGKRYFCDYCQRSFVDDIDSRKKHLNGVAHLNAKKEYYVLHRDLKTLIREERSKQVCRRFRNTGECQFGLSCNHTHYTEQELAAFELAARQQEAEAARPPDINEWLSTLRETPRGESAASKLPVEIPRAEPSSSYPPSLRPPTADQMRSFTASEWG